MRRLEARYPPDCLDVTVSSERVLACGALEWVTFAVEDRASLEAALQRKLVARPMVTVLDVVGRQLVVARKAAEGLPRVLRSALLSTPTLSSTGSRSEPVRPDPRALCTGRTDTFVPLVQPGASTLSPRAGAASASRLS